MYLPSSLTSPLPSPLSPPPFLHYTHHRHLHYSTGRITIATTTFINFVHHHLAILTSASTSLSCSSSYVLPSSSPAIAKPFSLSSPSSLPHQPHYHLYLELRIPDSISQYFRDSRFFNQIFAGFRKTVLESGFQALDSGFLVSGTWIPDPHR